VTGDIHIYNNNNNTLYIWIDCCATRKYKSHEVAFSELLYGRNTLAEGVFVTKLSINAGISVWRIVWVRTNCCFM